MPQLESALVEPGWESIIRAKLVKPWKFVRLLLLLFAVVCLPKWIQTLFKGERPHWF